MSIGRRGFCGWAARRGKRTRGLDPKAAKRGLVLEVVTSRTAEGDKPQNKSTSRRGSGREAPGGDSARKVLTLRPPRAG